MLARDGALKLLDVPIKRSVLSVIVLLVAFAFPLSADAHGRNAVPSEPEALAQYEAGLAAYYNNDFMAALNAWRPIADRDSGSSAAQIFLGFMYASGLGVERDAAAAAEWYRRAAEQDHALAQIRLALLHKRGEGVEHDPVQAYAWSELAARQEGHLQGIATALRSALAQGMTPEQVAEATELASGWVAAHRAGE